LAAATSAFIPPQAATEAQVAQSVELADEPPAAAELLEEPELLHPAASKTEPTAAAAATIAFDARKVKPSPCPPPWCTGDERRHLG
jgi:hypothetical protein